MFLMLPPVLCIAFRQFLIPDHEQIFGIIFLSCLYEIERTRDHCIAVNDNDLIVGYGMLRIYFDRDSRIIKKGG
jgi:hypothetical protein